MANGVSDILNVYRETLASERQYKMGEMQMALSMMQYESERMFREEGRRREDAYKGLAQSKESLEAEMEKDVSSAIAKLASILPQDVKDGKLVYSELGGRDRKKRGLSEDEATEIYNIVTMNRLPEFKLAAEEAVKRLSRRISAQHGYWKQTGEKGPYLAALTKAGILYSGKNEVMEALSFEPFFGITTGETLLSNVGVEINELAAGDYEITRDIGYEKEPLSYGVDTGGDIMGTLSGMEEQSLVDMIESEMKSEAGYSGESLSVSTDKYNNTEKQIQELRSELSKYQFTSVYEPSEHPDKDLIEEQIGTLVQERHKLRRELEFQEKKSQWERKGQEIDELALMIKDRGRAADIEHVPGVDQFGEREGYMPGTRPAYDIYGRIQR